MTKKEKNLIRVLKAMSDNAYKCALVFKDKDGELYQRLITESCVYDEVIRMIENKKELKEKANIFKIELD